jgi:hypothetical protein
LAWSFAKKKKLGVVNSFLQHAWAPAEAAGRPSPPPLPRAGMHTAWSVGESSRRLLRGRGRERAGGQDEEGNRTERDRERKKEKKGENDFKREIKQLLRITTLFSVRFFVSSLYCICALFLNLIAFSSCLSFLATWLLQELAALRFFFYLIGLMLPFLDYMNKKNYVCLPTVAVSYTVLGYSSTISCFISINHVTSRAVA